MKDFEVAIEWLLDCGLITNVYKVNSPSMPLKAYCKKYKPNYAVWISMEDYKEEEWITNIPLYAACNI